MHTYYIIFIILILWETSRIHIAIPIALISLIAIWLGIVKLINQRELKKKGILTYEQQQ